jgi:hypothetical protein
MIMQGNNKGKTVIKKISINAPIHHSPIISERVSRILISKVRARSDGGAIGSGRGQRELMLTAACHGRAWRLAGVQVFSSHGDQFPMRFAPTGS